MYLNYNRLLIAYLLMETNKNKQNLTNSTVKVLIRVRPLIPIEDGTNNVVSIKADEQSLSVKVDEYNVIQSKFDQAITENKSQFELFQNIRPFVKDVFSSYNLTIFAYGQTGSGKTFTMFGRDWENNFQLISYIKKNKSKQNTPLQQIYEDSGIIPRACFQIFQCFQQYKYDYNVFCSFLQIYNEKIYDLLNDNPNPQPLNIHQSKFEGIFVQGLGQFEVVNYIDCLQLLKRGQKNRKVRQTSMNAKSSRSHTIFKLIFESKQVNSEGVFSKVALNLCDLAGSEKINKNDKMENQHMQQLKNINLSLTTLGKVIHSLSKGQSKNIAAFRQSKLTRLLQESLTGNTNTFIICTLSPSSKNIDQTLSTLKFAQRARHIKLKFKPNIISSKNNEIIMKLQDEMEQLKRLLLQKQKQLSSEYQDQRMKNLELQNRKLQETFQRKENQFMSLLAENRKMKNQLMYMEKLARHEIYGVDDKTITINSSEISEQEPPKKTKYIKNGAASPGLQVSPRLNSNRNPSPGPGRTSNLSPNLTPKPTPRPSISKPNNSKQQLKQSNIGLPVLVEDSKRKLAHSQKDNRSPEQLQREKKLISERYQKLQEKRIYLENSVINNESNSGKNRRKSHEQYRNNRTIQLPMISNQTSTSSKARKTIDYRDRIRELQERLRK